MIYKIVNNINGHFYIGKTSKTIKERFERHKVNSRYNKQTHLYRAFNKYGIDNFSVELIEDSMREEYWIEKLKPHYNMTEGGDGGYTADSPNFIQGMKRYHSNKPRSSYATYGMLGKNQSESMKKTMQEKAWNKKSVSVYGKVYSSITQAQKDNPGISIRRRLNSQLHPKIHTC